jgi:hypothetical protein
MCAWGGTAGARAAGPSPSRGRGDAACWSLPGSTDRCVADRTARALAANSGETDQHWRSHHGIRPHGPAAGCGWPSSARPWSPPSPWAAPGLAANPDGGCSPDGVGALGLTRPGTTTSITNASTPSTTRPRTPIPGFLLDRGRYTKFDAPTAVTETGPNSINNRGQIVGGTGDPTVARVGYLLERGRVTTFSIPGAPLTFAFGINEQGQVVGFSAASPTATTTSGFLRDARGRITAINRPGATFTAAFDINNRGQIVGVAPIADTPPSPQPTSTPPMAGMS